MLDYLAIIHRHWYQMIGERRLINMEYENVPPLVVEGVYNGYSERWVRQENSSLPAGWYWYLNERCQAVDVL